MDNISFSLHARYTIFTLTNKFPLHVCKIKELLNNQNSILLRNAMLLKFYYDIKCNILSFHFISLVDAQVYYICHPLGFGTHKHRIQSIF